MPANEWTVEPPMLTAAMPVEAVTQTAPGSGYLSRSDLISSRRRTDLPVPVQRELAVREGARRRSVVEDNDATHLPIR